MTTTFEKNALLKIIQLPCNAASSKADMEIFKNVCFQVKEINGTLTAKCTGNNGKCETNSYGMALEGKEIGFVVNAQAFRALVNTYKSGNLTLEVVENKLHIKQGRSNQKLDISPVEIFPTFEVKESQDKCTLSVKSNALIFALNRVAFTSIDCSQDKLKCVNIWAKQGEVVFTSTNGVIVSRFAIPAVTSGTLLDASISPNVVSQLLNLKELDDDITLEISASKLQLRSKTVLLYASVVDSKYPLNSVTPLIEANEETNISFNKEEFKTALDRISIASQTPSKSTVILVESSKEGIRLSDSHSASDSEEFVTSTENGSRPFRIGLSLDVMQRSLNQINNNNVNFKTVKYKDKLLGTFEDTDYIGHPILMASCRV